MKTPIYLDSHATTKIDERVLSEMMIYFRKDYANPSSIDHIQGNQVSEKVEESRSEIAECINAYEDEIIFTSGATESNNLSILGVAKSLKSKGNHIITTKMEHKAILNTCSKLEEEDFDVTYLEVNKNGQISLQKLKDAINKRTILVSVMAANNEIGSILPIEKIGEILKDKDILFHTDATQIIAYKKIDVKKMNIDLMSISGHKIYGPKGIGALYVKRGIKLTPIMYGGGQERGIRPGTLNVPGIIGLSKAMRLVNEERIENSEKILRLRNLFIDILSKNIEFQLNGSLDQRLPNNISIFIPGIDAKALITKVKDYVSISAGSACNTDRVNPSHVMIGMGHDKERAFSTIRIGISKHNTEEEILFAAEKISQGINKMLNFFN